MKGNDLAQSVGAGKKPIEDDYEVQGHLDTLKRAHEIINNPDKMTKVHKLAGRHDKSIAAIKSLPTPGAKPVRSTQDLKDRYSQMTSPKPAQKAGLSNLQDQDSD